MPGTKEKNCQVRQESNGFREGRPWGWETNFPKLLYRAELRRKSSFLHVGGLRETNRPPGASQRSQTPPGLARNGNERHSTVPRRPPTALAGWHRTVTVTVHRLEPGAAEER